MTRAELRDMRLRTIAGVALSEHETLALIEACELLVEAVGPIDPTKTPETSHALGTIGREALHIVKQVRFS